jgi:hypothetical protein
MEELRRERVQATRDHAVEATDGNRQPMRGGATRQAGAKDHSRPRSIFEMMPTKGASRLPMPAILDDLCWPDRYEAVRGPIH